MPPEELSLEGSSDLSGVDVDGLMSGAGSEPREIPMGDETPQAPAKQDAPKTPAQTAAELAFTWNGKQIKAPLSDPRVTQWVSQGYDYAQKMQAFKQQQADFEQKQSLLSQLESKYKPVEEYYSQNPDRWQYVNQQYEALRQGLDPANPLAQKIQTLESKLSQYDQFIQQSQAKERNQQISQEDQALNQEIQSIRDEFKDLDWGSPDAEGKTLEYRVLNHANEIGTKSFRAAFRDFNHDHLLKRAEERGKENVVKERQKQTKLGLLGQSPTPKKGITNAENLKNKSYDDLIAEGLAELGMGS